MAWKDLFATKSLETLHEEMQGDHRLHRVLGPIGLTSLGVGAIIGSGIFVMTGEVAANTAGPGIVVSFLVAAFCCGLAAFCYAELASMAPVAGSAYTYAYATLGELLAWIIGWDLILEYAMSAATVAASWSKYFNAATKVLLGWEVPAYLCNDPWNGGYLNLPAVLIILACTAVLVIGIRESAASNTMLVLLKLGVVLFVIGVGAFFVHSEYWTDIPAWQRKRSEERYFAEAAREWVKDHEMGNEEARAELLANQALAVHRLEIAKEHAPKKALPMLLKQYATLLPTNSQDSEAVDAIRDSAKELAKGELTRSWGILGLLGVTESLQAFDEQTRSNFFPYGFSGVMMGAALVFFAFLGFDSVSTHAEEAIRPQRDVPFGIMASLVVCTLLYIAVSAVVTGMVPYYEIDPDAAVATAFSRHAEIHDGFPVLRWASVLIALGALAGMTSVLLITFLSQARIFLAMARDGLLPHSIFGVVHEQFKTPHVSTIVTGVAMAAVAAFTPIRALEEMVNIGTFFAFVIVCAAVLILRVQRPDVPRPFKCPLVFVVAPLGVLVNLLLMLFLNVHTWGRLVVWLAIGLVIYIIFGYQFSVLRHRNASLPAKP